MISYDTNILIYALEGTAPWAAASQAIVQQGEQQGAVLSMLTWQELMTGAVIHGGGTYEKSLLILQEFGATKFVTVSKSICERAVNLTKRYGRRVYGYDAIHLATAIEHHASVFITNDRMLLSVQVDGIEIRGL